MGSISFATNVFWIFIGNSFYAACQWGILILISKAGNPQIVGQYAISLAITGPIFMFLNMNLRGVLVTDAKEEYTIFDYIIFRIAATTISFIIILSLSFFYNSNNNLGHIIIIIGFAKSIESISDIFYGLLQKKERMDRIAFSLIAKGFLSILMFGILFYFTKTLFWGCIGIAFAWLATLFMIDIPNVFFLYSYLFTKGLYFGFKEYLTKVNRFIFIHLLMVSFPLGIVMMLSSLLNNIPRYFLQRFMGEYEVGLYSAIAYIMLVGNIIVNALGQTSSPRLARYFIEEDLVFYKKLFLRLLMIGFFMGCLGIFVAFFAGKELLTFLYKPEYGAEKASFVLLMFATTIGYLSSFTGYAITAARCFAAQVPLFIFSIAISTFTNYLLIPVFGLNGAAFSVIASNAVQLLGALVILRIVITKKGQGEL